jgi:hypothetical protein
MKLLESMLVYNPNTDQADVVPWPDNDDLGKKYEMYTLACYTHFHKCKKDIREKLMFISAYQAIVRDNVSPKAIHNAMLKIDEYREGISLNMQDVME